MENGQNGLITDASAAFRTIAKLAPGLSQRDLRVLLVLAILFADAPDRAGSISTRDLAERADLAHSNARLAIASLSRAGHISTTGRGHHAIFFRLTFAIRESGSVPGPGTPEQKSAESFIDHARRWIHGYHQVWRGQGYAAPPEEVLTRLCAILDPLQIENLIHELTAAGAVPRGNYTWYITEALRRRRRQPHAEIAFASARRAAR